MDKQIEELAKDLQEAWTAWGLSADLPKPWTFVAEILAKKWQPKAPEGVVVLTRAQEDKIFNDYVEYIKQVRKETAEKFAERLKADVSEDDELHEALNYYLKRDYFEYIDERCKEITEGV